MLGCLLTCALFSYQNNRREYMRDNNMVDQNTARQIAESVMRIKFDSIEHTHYSSCVICMEDFKDNDELTVLPCNNNHYFHASCVKAWIM